MKEILNKNLIKCPKCKSPVSQVHASCYDEKRRWKRLPYMYCEKCKKILKMTLEEA